MLTNCSSRVRCGWPHHDRNKVSGRKVLRAKRGEEMGYPRPEGRCWTYCSSHGAVNCEGDLGFHCPPQQQGNFEAQDGKLGRELQR